MFQYRQVLARLRRGDSDRALADEHQVIVFTHNIWFAAELLGKADKRKWKYYDIRSEAGETGVLSLWVVERHRIVGIRQIPVVPAILKLRQNRSFKPSQLNSGRPRTAVKDAVKRQRP